jgi:hypothetical protein
MKMNTKKALIIPGLMVALILLLVSCQKDNNTNDVPTDIESLAAASGEDLVQEATSNEVFDDVTGIDDVTAGDDLGIYGIDGDGIFTGQATGSGSDQTNQSLTRCFTVNVEPRERGVFPKTVTIDFGSGCEVKGHLRKGKIITVYSGRLHVPGNKAVTTFDNYSIDSFKIEGKHTVQNTTSPGSNQRSFSTTVENARITNINNGNWCSWNSNRKMTQVEGNGTPFFPRDDIFSITGSRSVACSNGKNWTSEITEPLLKKFTCKWIVKGVVKISLNKTVGLLDFGDGSCDNKATITADGVSRAITLR